MQEAFAKYAEKKNGSSTVCDNIRRKIEKKERRN
jgi:hypothetical protein